MHTIFIQNLQKTILTKETSRPLLYILREEFVDWMHACGGKGRCTTCKALIVSGMENLNELSDAERRYFENGELLPGERLACQIRITGDIVIKVPEETKLPHLHYTD
jgi:2Fe-2S ferredoxin